MILRFLIKIFGKEFIKFGIVGFVGFIIDTLVFHIANERLHIHYLVSTSLGFGTALTVVYFINKRWTFRVEERSRTKFAKYVAVYLFSLMVRWIILLVLIDFLNFDRFRLVILQDYKLAIGGKMLANILSIGITSISNFFGVKKFVFVANKPIKTQFADHQ